MENEGIEVGGTVDELNELILRIGEIAQDVEGSSVGMVGIPGIEVALNCLEGATLELATLKKKYEAEETRD